MRAKTFTVSDGELVLTLEALPKEEGGGYGVTSPFEPQLVTEAESLEQAFENARDAIAALRASREKSKGDCRARSELPTIKTRGKGTIANVTAAMQARLEYEEDLARHDRSFGR